MVLGVPILKHFRVYMYIFEVVVSTPVLPDRLFSTVQPRLVHCWPRVEYKVALAGAQEVSWI